MQGNEKYEIVVGLEIHAQLNTKSKLFCGDDTKFGNEANTHVSIISLAHPGTLPRLNKEAILKAVKLGIACNCDIVRDNYFARKNYFYPDLPKGYQISQHTTPICRNGFFEINSNNVKKKIRINRIHIEEDAGKSIHNENTEYTDLDFNRAGMPLLEIVTEPDIRSAEEAFHFVSALRKLVRKLGVSDGNMEQGRLRCDVNISVRKSGESKLGTRVEIKNLNSIRFIKKAIEFEASRLISLLETGENVIQQTRGFKETDFTTYAIRNKEDEDDYRYFPEPDLPPFFITDKMIDSVRSEMPKLEEEIKNDLKKRFNLTDYDAGQLANDNDLANYFLELSSKTDNYKSAANWIIGPVRNYLSDPESTNENFIFPSDSLAGLINFIDKGILSYSIASQKIFPAIIEDPLINIEAYIKANELSLQSSQLEIDRLIDAALNKYPLKIDEYKKGKKGLISLFVGEVMKLSKGKADAKLVTEKIIEKLKV
ncbi:MAG: Asp-tRNA(Asn)/Glu-tRNA(Gln) amidotransferase subunit GatB [Flavisolibacter sp.]